MLRNCELIILYSLIGHKDWKVLKSKYWYYIPHYVIMNYYIITYYRHYNIIYIILKNLLCDILVKRPANSKHIIRV